MSIVDISKNVLKNIDIDTVICENIDIDKGSHQHKNGKNIFWPLTPSDPSQDIPWYSRFWLSWDS